MTAKRMARRGFAGTSVTHVVALCVVALCVVAGCSAGSSPAPAAGGSTAASAGATAGSGTAGSGTAGSGTAGSGTAGSGTAGSGTDFAAPRGLPSGLGSGAADGEFPRQVAHFGGSTTIPAAPTRVVVISTGQLDATLTLGVVPAGSTRGSGATLLPAYLEQAFPGDRAELAAMQDLGLRLEPNLEAIAAAAPDLILVNAAGAKEIADQLANIAATVQTEGTGVNWKQDFLLVADALGKREQAQGVLDEFHEAAEQFGEGLAAPPTVSFLRTTSDRNRIFGVPSFAGSIAQDAGLARPASQQFDATSEDVSAEQIARADADWIFYGVQPGAESMGVQTNPLWPTLVAVQSGQVVEVDDDPWYLNAGPTAAALVLDQLIAAVG